MTRERGLDGSGGGVGVGVEGCPGGGGSKGTDRPMTR